MKKVTMIISFLIIGLMWQGRIAAQEIQNDEWSLPYQLSTEGKLASAAFMLSDQYGFVHVFWQESGFTKNRQVIQYARFDGQGWDGPLDIFATEPGGVVSQLSAKIDNDGRLHLAWTQGNSGPVFYSSAPMFEAMSARNWTQPVRLDVPAFRVQINIDSTGVLHMVYVDFFGAQAGVFYLKSENDGQDWSDPVWLDPDIPPDHSVGWVRFQVDDSDGLHIVWTYYDEKQAVNVGVRYINSLDAGQSWSSPFFIDVADETPDELRMANPGLIVQGDNVHIVYAGDGQTRREHRISSDRGRTWRNEVPIFGELHGQAIGDGLAIDANGRIHFIGQIRYPQGIWHAYWDESGWEELNLVYWFDPTVNYIDVHNTRLAIRTGNQMVMTFTDAPSDPQMRLFAMVRTLEEVPPLSPMPQIETTPTPDPYQAPVTVSETPVPTRYPISANTFSTDPDSIPNPGTNIWMGVTPSVILVALVLALRLYKRG